MGKEVSFVSLPGGRYNENVINSAKSLNYSALFSSTPFYLRRLDGIYLVGRYMITQPCGGRDFKKIITMSRLGKIKVRTGYIGKYLLKKLLGNKAYYCLWKKYVLRER